MGISCGAGSELRLLVSTRVRTRLCSDLDLVLCALNPLGDHQAGCPTARVRGARVNLDARATDARRIDALANGLRLTG